MSIRQLLTLLAAKFPEDKEIQTLSSKVAMLGEKKIIELAALVTQSSTDLYETSANGAGSFQETRAQMLSYMQQNVVPGTNYTPTDSIISGAASVTPNPSIYIGSKTSVDGVIIASASFQCVVNGDPVILQFSNPILANFTAITQAWLIGSNVKNNTAPAQADGDVLSLASVIAGGVQLTFTTSSNGTYNVNFTYIYRKIS